MRTPPKAPASRAYPSPPSVHCAAPRAPNSNSSRAGSDVGDGRGRVPSPFPSSVFAGGTRCSRARSALISSRLIPALEWSKVAVDESTTCAMSSRPTSSSSPRGSASSRLKSADRRARENELGSVQAVLANEHPHPRISWVLGQKDARLEVLFEHEVRAHTLPLEQLGKHQHELGALPRVAYQHDDRSRRSGRSRHGGRGGRSRHGGARREPQRGRCPPTPWKERADDEPPQKSKVHAQGPGFAPPWRKASRRAFACAA